MRRQCHPSHPFRILSCSALAVLTLALGACGGGGSAEPDPDPTPPSTPVAIDPLLGDWVQKGCVNAGAQSFKKLLRAQKVGEREINYSEGVLSFAGPVCAGAAQQAGPTRLGTVSFARSEANASLTAHWGDFLTVTGSRFGTIWTLRAGNLLCLLGDERPSIQPTLASISANLATVPQANCFSK